MAPRLPLRHAVVLGLVQGPAELLPVSSSAHIALLPQLLGWPRMELDGELCNHFEVALHGGAAAALLIARRHELAPALREMDRRRLALTALALGPPALVGYLLERRIERRPSSPRTLAAGLALGGAAMALADARGGSRDLADAGPRDGLALGLAQAAALLPGVSRNGATLAVARLRAFTREDAQVLSWRTGLPVILGAVALKGRRLALHGPAPGVGGALVAGATAAFLSTLATSPLVAPGRRARPLLPFALYRCLLALLAFNVRL
jgi:undecaprenyl-diphosphatase